MKKLAIFLLFAASSLFAQHIGQWRIFSDMKDVNESAVSSDGIWTATNGGAFMYNTAEANYLTLTKAEGLNSQNLTAVSLDKNGKVWFGSGEGYINIYDPESASISRIMDIFNTTKSLKGINNISISGDTAIVSTDFGISLINTENFSFYDSFLKVGNFSAELKIRNAFKSDIMYVLTDNGVAVQKSNAKNLSVPESWNTYDFKGLFPSLNLSKLIRYNSQLYIATSAGIYFLNNTLWQNLTGDQIPLKDLCASGSDLYAISDSILYKYSNGQLVNIYKNNSISLNSITSSSAGTLFISTSAGLLEYNNSGIKFLYPEGPQANSFNNIATDDFGNLWVATGKDAYGIGFMKYDGSTWQLFNRKTNPSLPTNAFYNVSTSGNKVILSTWGNGVIVYEDGSFTNFNTSNTDLVGIQNNPNFLAISDAKTDSKGNIWLVNDETVGRKQLSVITTDNKLYHYSFTGPLLTEKDATGNMVIDQYNTKWFIVTFGSTGLYYFNENGTFSNTSDDKYGKLTSSDGLITDLVSALAIDNRGQLWIGTSEGVNYMPDPSRPSTLTKNTAYSVRGQSVTCIAVDPLDQKWIGTKQGVFVLSTDGYQLLNYYTSKNSPLPNDDIRSIVIDKTTGIAYIGTDNGMAALYTSSIQPEESFSDIFVYPNPFIIDGINKQITIDGLVKGCTIKILDVSGNLIRSFQSPGGRIAFWDAKNEDGNYVASGIYIIVAYDQEANNISTSKVAVIKK